MKAISLWQPWASLWFGPKIHETRNWSTSYRGWLLVHAARRSAIQLLDVTPELGHLTSKLLDAKWLETVPRGAIIGAVKLEECFQIGPTSPTPDAVDWLCGNWEEGRIAWRRSETVLFKQPIPYRGRQRFFDVPWHLLPAECPIVEADRP